MQITEFIFTPGFPSPVLWPLVVCGVILLGATAVIVVARRRKQPDTNEVVGATVFVSVLGLVVFGLVAGAYGAFADSSREAKERTEYYTAQIEEVLDNYPSLRAGGVELFYSVYDSDKPGNLRVAINKQGSFVPLGTGYARAGSGVESFAYVMTLTSDWTLEIFQATTGDQLVKGEPTAS